MHHWKKKYLSKANESFVSSTAWTERTGFIAANAVIDFILKNKTYEKIKKNGKLIFKNWLKISKNIILDCLFQSLNSSNILF